jgi:adenylosuccinate synthase
LSKLQVIVGGQYGSEGKGMISGYLARYEDRLLAVRAAGPNAGHTVIGRCPPDCPDGTRDPGSSAALVADRPHSPDGHPWRLRQVPVAAVTNESAVLAIAPGSEIDPEVLDSEIRELDAAGYLVTERLVVDGTATLIEPRHFKTEKDCGLTARTGSTGKGIGAARADRALRSARLARHRYPEAASDVTGMIASAARDGGTIQIEGTQGYLLGQHAGHYPHCTSSDCTATDFLSMAQCPPWMFGEIEIWVVFRTYPIRVAGNSGPLPGETTWEAVGQPPEFTTVTQRIRRVGTWQPHLARRAIKANGGPHPFVRAALTMADYELPWIAGHSSLGPMLNSISHDQEDQFDQLVASRSKDLGTLVRLIGTGPASVLDLTGVPVVKKAYQVIP